MILTQLEEFYYDIACNVASSIMSKFDSARHEFSSSILLDSYDIKVTGDSVLSQYIIKRLSSDSGISVITEENIHGFDKKILSGNYYWLVDPIDGSANLSRDLPFVYSSISLIDPSGFPIAGVVIDLLLRKVFRGFCKRKLSFNLNPAFSSYRLDQSFVATGFPLGFDNNDLLPFVSQLRKFRKVRMYGSAVGSLLLLYTDKIDVYVESGIFPWDIAGVLPLINARNYFYYFTRSSSSEYGLDVIISRTEELLHSSVKAFNLPIHSTNTINLY